MTSQRFRASTPPGGVLVLIDDWQHELAAKVFGVLNPTRVAVLHLRRSDAARVVNISVVPTRARP
jgi:NAD(P)-dependent dehydrogenase (short-subunit alcohol dehydrogenase family)